MLRFFLLFNDSAYRKYLTSSYSYDYEYGGLDYDDISAANTETTAITPMTRKDAAIPTNCPIKQCQSLIWSECFFSIGVLYRYPPDFMCVSFTSCTDCGQL